MGSLANSSSLQTTIQENPLPLPLSAFSQLSLLTLKPSPRLRLMPTMAIMDMASLTMVMDMASLTTVTMGMLTPTPMDTTTARDLLMLSPLLRPLLSPTTVATVMALPTTGPVMAWLTTVTMAMLTLMLTDTTTARGPLMLSPLLMLTTAITTVMPHTVMLTAVTTVTLMLTVATTDTDTITKLLLFC